MADTCLLENQEFAHLAQAFLLIIVTHEICDFLLARK
jgi:hypothetical protein